MAETIPGSGKAREAFPIRFTCDVPPDEGGPPTHKHTGQTYVITPPKAALALKLAVRTRVSKGDPQQVIDGIYEWMDRAFGREVAGQLRRRLTGPEDTSGGAVATILGVLATGDLPEDVAEQVRALLLELPDAGPQDADFDESDEDDPLDLPDLLAAMQFTTERTAGVPPT